MNVHSATCSCSVELYKLWNTLADFFPNWNFRGVFSKYHNFVVRFSEPAGNIIFFRVSRISFIRGGEIEEGEIEEGGCE